MPDGVVPVLQPTGNVLLDALSPSQFAGLAASLSRVDMPRGAVLIEPHDADPNLRQDAGLLTGVQGVVDRLLDGRQ